MEKMPCRQPDQRQGILTFEYYFIRCKAIDYLLLIAACAAARRAIGTRNGEQDT